MKKLVGFLMISMLLILPLCADANIIGNVDLRAYYSSPTGNATFPYSGTHTYYFDYDVSLNSGALDEAFCVEDRGAPPSGSHNTYTLLSIDSGLSAFGLNASDYLAAAWVAEYYYTNYEGTSLEETWKAGAQLAIWEILFDSTFNLTDGNFKSTSSYATNALFIWNARPTTFPLFSNHWALAVNPTIGPQGGSIEEAEYQNYLVHHSVPEPASMLLLGLGLVGVAALRRKF